jgi:hypothetical protein
MKKKTPFDNFLEKPKKGIDFMKIKFLYLKLKNQQIIF